MPRRKIHVPSHPAHPYHWGQWLQLGVIYLVGRLPIGWARGLGASLGRLGYYLVPGRRRVVQRNLELCFPQRSAAWRRRLAKDNFRYLGQGLAETALSWHGGPGVDALPFAVHGREHLEAARADGTPVILLSGHFMCVEMAARLVGQYVDMGVIYKPMHKRPHVDAAMLRGRSRSLRHVLPREDIRGIVRALKGGTPIWYAGDQDYGRRHSVFADFFGVPAATITALTRLARMSGARVVPLYYRAVPETGGYEIEFAPALEGFPSGDEQTDARRMNAVIEQAVERAPAQYLWIHRRFKRQPDRRDLYADIPDKRRQRRRRRRRQARESG